MFITKREDDYCVVELQSKKNLQRINREANKGSEYSTLLYDYESITKSAAFYRLIIDNSLEILKAETENKLKAEENENIDVGNILLDDKNANAFVIKDLNYKLRDIQRAKKEKAELINNQSKWCNTLSKINNIIAKDLESQEIEKKEYSLTNLLEVNKNDKSTYIHLDEEEESESDSERKDGEEFESFNSVMVKFNKKTKEISEVSLDNDFEKTIEENIKNLKSILPSMITNAKTIFNNLSDDDKLATVKKCYEQIKAIKSSLNSKAQIDKTFIKQIIEAIKQDIATKKTELDAIQVNIDLMDDQYDNLTDGILNPSILHLYIYTYDGMNTLSWLRQVNYTYTEPLSAVNLNIYQLRDLVEESKSYYQQDYNDKNSEIIELKNTIEELNYIIYYQPNYNVQYAFNNGRGGK